MAAIDRSQLISWDEVSHRSQEHPMVYRELNKFLSRHSTCSIITILSSAVFMGALAIKNIVRFDLSNSSIEPKARISIQCGLTATGVAYVWSLREMQKRITYEKQHPEEGSPILVSLLKMDLAKHRKELHEYDIAVANQPGNVVLEINQIGLQQAVEEITGLLRRNNIPVE